MRLIIYADGACKGNPGPAAIGVLVKDHHQKELVKISEYIGYATNNKAEYSAVVAAMKTAIKLKADEVVLYIDSELVVRQLTGRYKVKSSSILPLYTEANELLKKFTKVSIIHTRREDNTEADKLATAALSNFIRHGIQGN
jgi:ribonuclease HI